MSAASFDKKLIFMATVAKFSPKGETLVAQVEILKHL